MKAIPLRAKIGQLIATGFPAAAMTGDLKRLITDYKIGNIILFSHNVADKSQLGALCAELQRTIAAATGYPALIAIDQEGGRVTRLPADASNVPGAMAIAATGRPENAYAAGRLTARELRALGINFNLAPVLDINNNKANPVINVRSYGDAAETVEAFALPMLRGLKDEGVLAAVKHFPGHGDTAVDSHLGLPVIDKTLAELRELELKPFRAAIAAGAEAIMSSHILFPRVEAERVPATMSRTVITDLLKRELGFDGLVVSDCLEMDAIKAYYGTARGALGALKAGVHLLFISHTPALVMEAAELIEQAVSSGELAESVIDDALAKVLAYKAKYAMGTPGVGAELAVVGCDVHRRAVAAMSRESICRVGGEVRTVRAGSGDTLFVGTLPYRTDQASSLAKAGLSFPAAMGAAFDAPIAEIGIDPGEAEIERALALAAGCAHVVVGLYHAREYPGQLKLMERLATSGKSVTAVALGKPYDLGALPAGACGLAAFDYTPLALDSLIAILQGSVEPAGRIPLAGFAGAVRQ
ncbi:beta-N-acetylhexosaminidase [Paenibacillus sp. GCM10023250]|uniref:beta-N-acetylhexosaminidase n=1 Tax=Paenibacillus sp. GCM10023250 TaxID=3252648 RepID=UPI003620428E